MKYLMAFLNFWRKFVVGDDKYIAISVMWIILLNLSLSSNYFNVWAATPLLVGVVMFVIVNYYTKSITLNIKRDIQYGLQTYIPALVVYLLPLLYFQLFISSASDIKYLLLDKIIYTLVVILLAILLYKPFSRYPVGVVAIFGLITLLRILN